MGQGAGVGASARLTAFSGQVPAVRTGEVWCAEPAVAALGAGAAAGVDHNDGVSSG